MSAPRLPESALWETLRILTPGEKRRLRERIRGTRLEWLMDTLIKLESYSEKKLYAAYRRAFPEAKADLLRTYKRDLWQAIEDTFMTETSEDLGQEIQIWRRLWLSVVLWRRRLIEPARILWHQAVQAAIDTGWYEVALWGFSLLEMHMRDYHRLKPTEAVSRWGKRLLGLINSRYTALINKAETVELYVLSRSETGWTLPTLPDRDVWADFLRSSAALLRSSIAQNFHRSFLSQLIILESLLSDVAFLSTYRRFRLSLAFLNMSIALLNLRCRTAYDQWYNLWERLWHSGYWTPPSAYEDIHCMMLGTRIIYLIHGCQWNAARRLWDIEKERLQRAVLDSITGGNIGFRMQVGMSIYLALLMDTSRYQEAVRWRLLLEGWMEQENFRDYPYLWWTFLRWYEAYRLKDRRWMRYWYRRLWVLWREHFSQDTHWQPVLGVLRALTMGLPRTQRRRIEQLQEHWTKNPGEHRLWVEEALYFPLEGYFRAVLMRRRLEDSAPEIPSECLPASLTSRFDNLINRIQKIIHP